VIYLDSSAIVKLARSDAETPALRAYLAHRQQPLSTSTLARTETARALARTEPRALTVLPAVLALLHQKPVTEAVLDAAARLPEPGLRTLDAIHLATADELRAVITGFVTYDKRQAAAAAARGLPVATPA
jgi:uncharacterized protein